MKMYEKTIKKNMMYSGRIINVRCDDIEDCYGNDSKREIIEHPGGVCVIAIDDDNNIFMVSQYRYGVGEVVLEVPAGKLEPGEDPLECGKRELIEETGYKAEKFDYLGVMYPTPAYDSEKIYLYMARDLSFVGQKFDQGEYLEVKKINLGSAVRMVLDGEIPDAKTQICILKANLICSIKQNIKNK